MANNNRQYAQPGVDDGYEIVKWRGYDLDQIRRQRAKALIRLEVGKVKMEQRFVGMKQDVSSNGVRALMFSDNTIAKLKLADYVALGWKFAMAWRRWRNKRNRKRNK